MNSCFFSRCCGSFGILLLLMSAGCPKKMPMIKTRTLTPKVILASFAREAEKRKQVSGTFRARSTGFKRIFGSINLDIVAQAPASLYLSAHSFFNQPARVLATDGEDVYLLEMHSNKEPSYEVHPIGGDKVQEVLPLPLTSKEVVQVLLGVFENKELLITDIKASPDNQTYVVKFTDEQKKVTEIKARMSNDVILKRTQYDEEGNQVYAVTYEHFHVRDGVDFAEEWEFEVNLTNKSYGVMLKGESIRFNGELFEESTFRIEAP